MSRRVSPSTDQVYGLQRVTRIWGVSRATVYRHRQLARQQFQVLAPKQAEHGVPLAAC